MVGGLVAYIIFWALDFVFDSVDDIWCKIWNGVWREEWPGPAPRRPALNRCKSSLRRVPSRKGSAAPASIGNLTSLHRCAILSASKAAKLDLPALLRPQRHGLKLLECLGYGLEGSRLSHCCSTQRAHDSQRAGRVCREARLCMMGLAGTQ